MLLLNGRTALATALLCAAVSLEGQAAIRSVNCDAGDTIQGALPDIKSGDTLLVSGTCTGTVTIPPEMVNVTLDGKGAANIRGPNGFVVLGREITIRGFDVTAVGNGISVFRGGTAVIDGNTIHDTGGGLGLAGRGLGINVAQHSFAAIVSNRIRNNPGTGINVIEASAVRLHGWRSGSYPEREAWASFAFGCAVTEYRERLGRRSSTSGSTIGELKFPKSTSGL